MGSLADFLRGLHGFLAALWFGAGALALRLRFPADDKLPVVDVYQRAHELVDSGALLIGPALIITLLGSVPLRVPLRLRAALAGIATLSAAFSEHLLRPEMKSVRAAMGRMMSDLPSTDPLVEQHADLGTLAAGLLVVQTLAAGFLLATAAAARQRRGLGTIEV